MPEHAHEWPVLSLFVMGSYLNETEAGTKFISGPSAILYRAGAAHRNTISAFGFEQIEIEFDPTWLGPGLLPWEPVTAWIGGRTGREAHLLAHACDEETREDRLRAQIRRFLKAARQQPGCEPACWIGAIAQRLRDGTTLKISDLAMEANRHTSWLGSAYRQAAGEGLRETAARMRVERATHLLRETQQPYASIAYEAGFCDQSHMNRTFRRVLGRTPGSVREDRRAFRGSATGR